MFFENTYDHLIYLITITIINFFKSITFALHLVFVLDPILICIIFLFEPQDTEILLTQLEKDQLAVDQVREIVQAEEAEMQKETDIVQNYADVSIPPP